MRADRLLAALLLLQARGRVTAAELAAELEVSVATARRDLAALSAAGIPVYPQPGRGGGWALVGGARTDLSGLSAPEAQALFLRLGPAAAGSDAAKAALRKLVRALPATFRPEAEAAARATMVDPVGWGGRGRRRPALVDRLQEAVIRRRRVRLSYRGRTGQPSERVVDPWGLIDKDDIWYLLAGTERGQRTFRVDRIESAEVLPDTFDWPDGFTLAAAWERVVAEIEQRRTAVWATVRIEARFVPILRDQFGELATRTMERSGELATRTMERSGELASRADERVRVRVGAPTPLDLARQLAGWGGLIEVEEPASVREILGRIGVELVARYATGPVPDRRTSG